MVYQLSSEYVGFPATLEPYGDEGLVAVGGRLSVEYLVAAYMRGIFPWYSAEMSDQPLWFCPARRFVIMPDEVHVSHSMRTLINSGRYRTTYNQAFDDVIGQCGALRAHLEGAWLTEEIIRAYTELHRLKLAESVEVWEGDRLVGGLYGVTMGRNFFGESMFSLAPSASKLALIELGRRMTAAGGGMIDCQFSTPHLASMGGRHIPYREYMTRLYANLRPA